MRKEEFNKKDIQELLEKLNEKCFERGIHASLLIVGGAVMSLCYDARDTTRDIDCLFEPKSELQELIFEIAQEKNLNTDWINDGVKGFIKNNVESEQYLELSNLSINVISAKCMLAMKLTSARLETSDFNDSLVLMRFLKIKEVEECFDIVEKYCIHNTKTQEPISLYCRFLKNIQNRERKKEGEIMNKRYMVQ